ncbi:hypothetical protein Pcinc_036513 [Petrolisthes cinctipes]|uniref:Uncharacterized protein n=1 Tax=Petrolisthes cinctipes TaxID=88211 RepID=A0AAE1EPH5_PETCI|nr:hypothetical protein Pcinc_036513 [Petrolisthes cinctipes]
MNKADPQRDTRKGSSKQGRQAHTVRQSSPTPRLTPSRATSGHTLTQANSPPQFIILHARSLAVSHLTLLSLHTHAATPHTRPAIYHNYTTS